jgi:predicted RNA-binding protein associated with RNAse of E/G family
MLETIWQHVFWIDRLYNLTEEYTGQGEPKRLDLDIASTCWADGAITYRDHELDVFKAPDQPAEVRDEDEFADAIVQYGYTPEFQAACRSALQEAVQVADSWSWLGCPHFENTPSGQPPSASATLTEHLGRPN